MTSDSDHRRLVYAVVSERVKHYSASAQVFDDGNGARLNWTVDVLPSEVAPYIGGQMDLGAAAMRKALARKAAYEQ